MFDLPLMTYVVTMSVTPGPNNLMLAASGVNFGFRRTLPHMLGVSIGHGVQVVLVASLLAWIMVWLEALRVPLVIAGCAYLLWLAWRQARAGEPASRGQARPLGFFGAALFQWVNPKAWMMVLNVAILFLPRGSGWQAAAELAWWCAVVNLPCIALWALAGDRMGVFLQSPVALRAFNWAMAALLGATAAWILIDELVSK
ncbi:LysE family translocator [Aromatoleum toluolicum]|uniref:LysE family transporter n=1 Tax=Aromatoleum toluolicum TaxID=90060 RepID=A0ABX1NHL8_9RHOO|nr:LysE family translocator [Aromatoleum toluolicum]NMF98751.1 LysE family translocator [Aromatoleum toluolicum]